MDFDIDIEKIADPTRRELYREAFSRLENHEAEVMAEASIYISQEGKIGYLTKLMDSRKYDLNQWKVFVNSERDFTQPWFSSGIGIQKDLPFTRPLNILICNLTIDWLGRKIVEIREQRDQNSLKLSDLNNSETALIFYFGMGAFGLTPRKDENISSFARFLHALMRKPFTSVANSDFYGKLRMGTLVTEDPRLLLKYLQNVRAAFEQCEFKEPLVEIDKEIAMTKRGIVKSKSS